MGSTMLQQPNLLRILYFLILLTMTLCEYYWVETHDNSYLVETKENEKAVTNANKREEGIDYKDQSLEKLPFYLGAEFLQSSEHFKSIDEKKSFFAIPKDEVHNSYTPLPTKKYKSPPTTERYNRSNLVVPFSPTCGLALESGGNIRIPIPIGGLCGYKRTIKECNGKCIERYEVCGGRCSHNQCLKKDKSSCVEMFLDGNEFGKMLFKDCEGHCIPASKKCRDHCHESQCWEPHSKKCLDPDKDRAKDQIEKGIYSWKNCRGICKKSNEICENSCGNPSLFCWDEGSRKCLSLEEKTEFGKKLRSQCECKCIPYAEKCKGSCGVGECEEGGRCVDALELNQKNERFRKSCEGQCIPWDQNCEY